MKVVGSFCSGTKHGLILCSITCNSWASLNSGIQTVNGAKMHRKQKNSQPLKFQNVMIKQLTLKDWGCFSRKMIRKYHVLCIA